MPKGRMKLARIPGEQPGRILRNEFRRRANVNSTVRQPDALAEGLCRILANLSTADKGMNMSTSQEGVKDREAARELCSRCPARQPCLEYVVSQETPQGSWGGVWGGLDPFNRRGRAIITVQGGTRMVKFNVDGYVRASL